MNRENALRAQRESGGEFMAVTDAEIIEADLEGGASHVRQLLSTLHDFFCRELEIWAQTDVDGVTIGDDLGTAEGPLRPAGKARFGGMLVDVVTQGDYLDTGARLEVIERRGNHVVVRPVADA